MISFELYRIFKIVADEENITKASNKLNISQPAVTKHIKNLEKLLKIQLFERNNTGLSLTEKGKKIYEEIKEPVIVLDSIYKRYSGTSEINLGIHAAMLSRNFNEKIMNHIRSKNVNTMNYNTDEMLSKLEIQEIDIAISKKHPTYENDKIEFIQLGVLHDILVTKPYNIESCQTMTIEELKERELYLPRNNSVTAMNFFDSINIKESEFKNIRNISYIAMLESIKDTNAVALITKEYVKDELENKNIVQVKTDFKIKPVEYGMYINKENLFKELREFINAIKLENI